VGVGVVAVRAAAAVAGVVGVRRSVAGAGSSNP